MPDMQEDRFNCLDFMSTMDLQIRIEKDCNENNYCGYCYDLD